MKSLLQCKLGKIHEAREKIPMTAARVQCASHPTHGKARMSPVLHEEEPQHNACKKFETTIEKTNLLFK